MSAGRLLYEVQGRAIDYAAIRDHSVVSAEALISQHLEIAKKYRATLAEVGDIVWEVCHNSTFDDYTYQNRGYDSISKKDLMDSIKKFIYPDVEENNKELYTLILEYFDYGWSQSKSSEMYDFIAHNNLCLEYTVPLLLSSPLTRFYSSHVLLETVYRHSKWPENEVGSRFRDILLRFNRIMPAFLREHLRTVDNQVMFLISSLFKPMLSSFYLWDTEQISESLTKRKKINQLIEKLVLIDAEELDFSFLLEGESISRLPSEITSDSLSVSFKQPAFDCLICILTHSRHILLNLEENVTLDGALTKLIGASSTFPNPRLLEYLEEFKSLHESTDPLSIVVEILDDGIKKAPNPLSYIAEAEISNANALITNLMNLNLQVVHNLSSMLSYLSVTEHLSMVIGNCTEEDPFPTKDELKSNPAPFIEVYHDLVRSYPLKSEQTMVLIFSALSKYAKLNMNTVDIAEAKLEDDLIHEEIAQNGQEMLRLHVQKAIRPILDDSEKMQCLYDSLDRAFTSKSIFDRLEYIQRANEYMAVFLSLEGIKDGGADLMLPFSIVSLINYNPKQASTTMHFLQTYILPLNKDFLPISKNLEYSATQFCASVNSLLGLCKKEKPIETIFERE